MTKQKSTKRALLMSALALLMCVSMLIGSTFAWFTDSVTSAGNKIQAGTLDIELWKVNSMMAETEQVKDEALFNYDLWEPGYAYATDLKLKNVGTLDAKFIMTIVPTTEVGELAEVIDVYYTINNFVLWKQMGQITGNTSGMRDYVKENYAKLGTLKDVLDGTVKFPETAIGADNDVYIQIAMVMQESAGNEYQGKSAGVFDLRILATQDNVEGDSFGTDYDENAEFDKVEVKFPTALVKGQNGSYRFADNGANRGENAYYSVPTGDYTDAPFFSQEFAANNTFDGSGATFADVQVLANYCTEEGDVFEVKNVKSEGTLTVGSAGGTIIVNNCEFKAIRVSGSTDIIIKNSTVNGYGENRNGDAGGYGMHIIPAGDYKLSVLNNTINNCDMHCIAVQANGAGDIEVSGNTFKAWGSSTTKTERAAFKIWGDTVLAPTNMSSYAELGVEAKALVADILANNTFPSDLTAIGGTGTQVIFDFFDAAFSAAN